MFHFALAGPLCSFLNINDHTSKPPRTTTNELRIRVQLQILDPSLNIRSLCTAKPSILFDCLSARVDDVSACDLSLVHQVVDHLELRKTNSLEWGLDHTTAEEFEGFGGVLAVADVRATNVHHLDDGLEDWSLQVGTGWQTNADDGTTWADVLDLVSTFPISFFALDLPQRLAGMASRSRRRG